MQYGSSPWNATHYRLATPYWVTVNRLLTMASVDSVCNHRKYEYHALVTLEHTCCTDSKSSFVSAVYRDYGRIALPWLSPFMTALCNRAGHYSIARCFLSSSFFLSFFSLPNLSRSRLDVCHTSTHGVALVRIYNAGLKCAAHGSLEMQDPKKWPTRNRKHRRAAAKPAACAKPLML